MVGVIAILTAFFVPTLFWKRCSECGARNALDAAECKTCEHPFAEE